VPNADAMTNALLTRVSMKWCLVVIENYGSVVVRRLAGVRTHTLLLIQNQALVLMTVKQRCGSSGLDDH
jgi:hypothetical protein